MRNLQLRIVVCVAVFVALVFGAVLLVNKRPEHIALIRSPYDSNQSTSASPSVILWAWERPEDLRYINPQTTGVAFLSKTVYLRRDRVITRPRLQPLQLAPGTAVVPVARIESDRKQPPTLSPQQLKQTVTEIAGLARLPNVATIQIDFDATAGERQFYRALLTELRRSLPSSTRLSITALASWCEGDNWLEDLPIDEAIPMLFRMGVDRNAILSNLAGDGFNSSRCRSSAGISTDEYMENLPLVARLYVFNPSPWTADSVHQVMEKLKK